MRKRAALAALALLAFAGACHLAPPHVRPAAPTPSSYPADYAGDVALGARATDVAWRDFFPDPRLAALVGAALTNNRDLAASVARVEEARGLLRIQNAERVPNVGANAGATRTRTGAAGIVGAPNGVGAATFDRLSVGVGTSAFELDFWGRVRNLSEAARSQYLATVQAQRAFRLSLVRDVAAAYLASREAAERIQLAESTVTSRQAGVRIARTRLDAGITSALDFHQAESLLTQAEADLAGLRLAKAQRDNLLVVLVGGPVAEPLPDPLPLTGQASPVVLAAGLPSELMVARPDIVAAEEQLRAARANIGAARAAFFPSISLTGTVGFASTELGNLVGNEGLTWSVGPSLSLPIFDGGRRRGNLVATRARERIAIAGYQRTIQTAFQEVADALAGRRYLAEQVDAQARGVVAQRQIADLAQIRYREGAVGYIEVLDAQRNLFAAEQTLLVLRRAQADNLVALYVALGGGLESSSTDGR